MQCNLRGTTDQSTTSNHQSITFHSTPILYSFVQHSFFLPHHHNLSLSLPSVSVTILRKHLPSRRPLWIGSVDRASITSCPEDSLTNTFMPHCCTVTALYPFESLVCIEIEPLLIANMFIKE